MTLLTIERLVPGGDGLARDEAGVVFVSGVAPGDEVLVAPPKKAGGARRARLLSVVSPSPDRVALDCDVADRCGGCDWLHLSVAARARHKLAIVHDALRRVGRLDDEALAAVAPLAPVPLSRELAGRRRCRVRTDAQGRATFSEKKSHARASPTACLALHPTLEAALLALPRARLGPHVDVRLTCDDEGVVAALSDARAARALVDAGVVRGSIVVDADAAVDRDVIGAALVRGEVTAGSFAAVSDAATFTQATRAGGEAIRDAVLEAVDDAVDRASVLELFAGAGHLTLPLAARAARVTAVERDARATRHLAENRALVDGAIVPVTAFIDAAFVAAQASDVDLVVADPPRTGLVGAREVFLALRAPRVVLVSCDPATGARDLRAALDAGYRVLKITPIDAFPRTHHVEWVVHLERTKAPATRR